MTDVTMDITIVTHQIESETPEMAEMKASEFKAKCLRVIDEVAASGDELIVTKNGKPLVKMVPYRSKRSSLWGLYAGRIEMHDDLVEPIDVEWEASQG